MRSVFMAIGALLAGWLIFIVLLVVAQHKSAKSGGWRDAVRLVPDALRLVRRLAILIAFVLRRLARRAGADKIDQHWPGTPEVLVAFRALLRLA